MANLNKFHVLALKIENYETQHRKVFEYVASFISFNTGELIELKYHLGDVKRWANRTDGNLVTRNEMNVANRMWRKLNDKPA